jgi:hypothetical protein
MYGRAAYKPYHRDPCWHRDISHCAPLRYHVEKATEFILLVPGERECPPKQSGLCPTCFASPSQCNGLVASSVRWKANNNVFALAVRRTELGPEFGLQMAYILSVNANIIADSGGPCTEADCIVSAPFAVGIFTVSKILLFL